MAHKTRVTYLDDLGFEVALDGHTFKVDADEQFGGRNRGPKPKNLLLSALGGCTGMDVASILKKMRMEFDEFWIDVSGETADEDPKSFTEFTVTYCFRGDKLDREKIEKAVNLSQERYCSVSAMFRTFAPIKIDIKLNP